MKNLIKYFNTPLFTLMLSVVLLANAPFVLAQEATNQLEAKQTKSLVKQQVVNINKSTFDELVTLKGIGHTRAQAIIVYRQEVGAFKSVAELSKVSGIGDKIVSDNKARLSI